MVKAVPASVCSNSAPAPPLPPLLFCPVQSGLSRDLFEAWCTDRRNGVIVAGYSVEGTLAKHILTQPSEITTLAGKKLPLRMSVGETQAAFTSLINGRHLILIHTCTSGAKITKLKMWGHPLAGLIK